MPTACETHRKVFVDAKVVANQRIAPDGWKLTLSAPEIARTIRPGQFVNVYVHAFDPSVLLPRPFSVYDYDTDRGTIDLVHQAIGPGTRAMSRLAAGDAAPIVGPLGNGFFVDPPARRLVCVAGGIGITPFLAMLRRYPHENAVLLFGGRTRDFLFGLDDFERLGVEVKVSTDDGSAGHKGLVTDLLEKELAQGTEGLQIASCGPHPMLRAVARIANRARIPAQLSMENHMPCGLGACRGCAWPVAAPAGSPKPYTYKLLCAEGPILWAEEVLWPAQESHAS